LSLLAVFFKFKERLYTFLVQIGSIEHTTKLKQYFFWLWFLFIEFLLLLRSFFKIERPILAIFISSLILLNFVLDCPISVESSIIIQLLIGLYLINFDFYGQLFSEFFLTYPASPLALSFTTFLTRQTNSKFVIVRNLGLRAGASIFFGKSGLTPTGKASIVVAASSAAALAYNSYRDRIQKEDHFNRDQQNREDHFSRDQQNREDHFSRDQQNREDLQKREQSFQANENEKQRQHEKERWAHEERMSAQKSADSNNKSSWWRK